MNLKHPITQFRIVALGEGISYLLLLGVAMPLKYLYDQPLAVRIVGSIHGGLFLLYLVTVFRAAWLAKWNSGRIAEAIIASLLPFGPFYVEYRHHREFEELSQSTPS